MGDDLRTSSDLIRLLAPAIEDAVVTAVARSGVPAPFVIELRARELSELPPFVRVGGQRLRERMTALDPADEAALRELWRAEPPDGVTLAIDEYLDDDARAACREVSGAVSWRPTSGDPEAQRAREVWEKLGYELSERLNRREWREAADPFLALVQIGRGYDEEDAYALATAAIGHGRVDEFRTSLKSRARWTPGLPAAAREDREALRALLEQRGLGDEAVTISETAQVGLRLVAAETGARSRLGGSGLLPAGAAWPYADNERPLTFLAGIDLSELAVGSALPESGWLLFYADLSTEETGLGLIEPVTNAPDAPARIIYADETEVAEAPVPEDPFRVLRERRVAGAPTLTLADDDEAGARLGLDTAAASVYEQTAHELRYGSDRDADLPDHWVLGGVAGVQGVPAEPGTVLLLHMAWDEDLGFEFLDGGAVQFRIAEHALRKRDWSAATAEPDSC